MVKPRGKVTRRNKPAPGLVHFLDIDVLEIATWCPDTKAQLPAEQVHLILHIQDLEDIPFVIRFKSPDTLGFLIEELAAYRRQVWPAAEPLDVGAQTKESAHDHSC